MPGGRWAYPSHTRAETCTSARAWVQREAGIGRPGVPAAAQYTMFRVFGWLEAWISGMFGQELGCGVSSSPSYRAGCFWVQRTAYLTCLVAHYLTALAA